MGRSRRHGSLPPAGVRITPAYAAQLPKIRSATSTSALRTATAAHHYKLMFLEFQANLKPAMGALAEEVALTTGGITRLLDRMIGAGLVERRPCPTDRRVAFAALTPAGRTKIEEAAAIHAADLQEIFAVFSAKERRTLDELLDRLRAHAQRSG